MTSAPRQHHDRGTDRGTDPGTDLDRIGELMSSVGLPLVNLEFALEQYLLANGQRLDSETRTLLAGVRDCVGRVAASTRRLSNPAPADSERASLGRAA